MNSLKVKKRVRKQPPTKSVPDRRDSGASEPRVVNPRDPRLRRDSGASEPRPRPAAGNPRDPRLQQRAKNAEKSAQPPQSSVMELSHPQVWDKGAKQQPALGMGSLVVFKLFFEFGF